MLTIGTEATPVCRYAGRRRVERSFDHQPSLDI
jgi:hypothetical protein